MNNFNLLLTAIREQCKTVNVPYEHCIDDIVIVLAPQHRQHLDFYLDFLQDLGLITYDLEDGCITLTERGKYSDTLFQQ